MERALRYKPLACFLAKPRYPATKRIGRALFPVLKIKSFIFLDKRGDTLFSEYNLSISFMYLVISFSKRDLIFLNMFV